MSNINILTFVIDAASATTTDNVKQLQQKLWVGATAAKQVPVCRFLDIIPASYKKKVANAATNGVNTLTFVGTANSTEYAFLVRQYNQATRNFFQKTYSFVTPSNGPVSATTIALQAKGLLDADPQFHGTVAAALGVLTITTEAGYEIVVYDNVTGDVTPAVTTAGVLSYGITPYYALTQYGLVAGTDFTGSTSGYTTYTFDYTVPLAPESTTSQSAVQTCVIFINTDSANAAALITAIDTIFAQAAFITQTVKVA